MFLYRTEMAILPFLQWKGHESCYGNWVDVTEWPSFPENNLYIPFLIVQ